MPFDYCSECKRCCNVDAGYEPLEITLTAKETKAFHSICIQTSCEYLGNKGCTLGDKKPYSCKMYPLVYNPSSQELLYDTDCPIMPKYIAQLRSKDSEASNHLLSIQNSIALLTKVDIDFLDRNFAVDQEYFEIKKLPIPSTKLRHRS
jgi:Fe-S-cluster containining protein